MSSREPARAERLLQGSTSRLGDAGLRTLYRAAFRAEGVRAEGVQPWEPRDGLRCVDWKVSARRDALHVRTLHEERDLTLLFAVDVSARMATGSTGRTRAALASEFVALMSRLALDAGDSVGLLTFADEPRRWIPPASRPAQQLRMERALSDSDLRSARGEIDTVLTRLRRLPFRRPFLFLLSDYPTPLPSLLDAAARRFPVVPVHVGDPLDEALPALGGLLQVRDPQSGCIHMLDLSSPRHRNAWQEAATSAAARRHAAFRKAGTLPLYLRTDRRLRTCLAPWLETRIAWT